MILHHWDTDGIASAAIYMNIHGEDSLFTPKIGNFFLDEEDFKKAIEDRTLVILDMNLPEAPKLCDYVELRIYDHHKANKVECAVEHYNPYIWGKHYPSCTTVLMERFSYPPDYLVALGLVGDNGPKTRNLREWSIIENVLRREDLSFEDLLKAANLIDSSFKLDRRDEVVENVHLVRNGIRDVLNSERLHRNLEIIEMEIERWASRAEDCGTYYFLEMESPYHIISSVTRHLVWNRGKSAIVINHKDDRDEFYVRFSSEEFSAFPLIEIAKARGYRAGGKKEVMGAILPKGEGREFAEKVLEVLKW